MYLAMYPSVEADYVNMVNEITDCRNQLHTIDVILIRRDTDNFPSSMMQRSAPSRIAVRIHVSLFPFLISYGVQMQMLKRVIHSMRSTLSVPDREGAFVRPPAPG